MPTYAVVDSNGDILNIVVWDGSEGWRPPDGTTAVECNDGLCQIGGIYKDGVFLPPDAPEPSKEELIMQAASMKNSLLSEANSYTQAWQTQLMLNIISDADKASLLTWMKYYQQLQLVDLNNAPDIDWPKKPI